MKRLTKTARRLNASKRSKQKRMTEALRKYLQQQNPGTKLAGAKVQKLKGGVLKITPIKANAGAGDRPWLHSRYKPYKSSSPAKSKGKGPYYVGNYGPISTLKEAKAIVAMLRRQGDKSARINTW